MANKAATPDNTPSNAQKACVVCGLGSHRTQWVKTLGEYVACDHHSDAEIKEHVDIVKKEAAGVVSAPKPATQPLTSSTQKFPQAVQAPTTASVPAIGATPNTPKTDTPAPDPKGVIGGSSPSTPAKASATTPTETKK